MDPIHAVLGVLVALSLLLLARWLRSLIQRAMERRRLRADMVQLVLRIFYGVAIAIALLAGFSLITNQPTLGLTGFVTAAVITSLGLQDLVKNYVAGYYVLLEHNIKVGDLVETQGYRGIVSEVRMRVTYLRGESGELIVVPNSELFNKTLVISPPPLAAPAPQPAGSPPSPRPPRRRSRLAEGPQDDPNQGVESVPV